MWKLLLSFLGRRAEGEREVISAKQTLGMPIKAGRSSVSPHEIYYGMNSLEPEFGLQWLPIIQNLSVFHHDVKKAVDNIIALSNTELEMEFDSSVSPRNASKMRAYLSEAEKGWIKNGTQNTLINSLFRQIAVYGALSAERVVSQGLNGIDEIVMVSPQRIRFVYQNGLYLPHQQTPILADTRMGLKQLNTSTYKYIPLVMETDTPYVF